MYEFATVLLKKNSFSLIILVYDSTRVSYKHVLCIGKGLETKIKEEIYKDIFSLFFDSNVYQYLS